MNFDAKAAKALSPGTWMAIDGCPGLRLISNASSKTWVYRYRSPIDQKLRQTKIGGWPAVGLPNAIAKWTELRDARNSGKDRALDQKAALQEKKEELIKSELAAYTVRQAVDDYLAGHVALKRNEQGQVRARDGLNRALAAGGLEDLAMCDVTRAQAFDTIAHFAKTPALANIIRLDLAGAWDFALDSGRVNENTVNWWRRVMKGKLKSAGRQMADGSRKKRVSLRAQQIGELLRFLPHFSPAVADLLTLYLWTGCRGGEIVSMEVSEITRESDGLWWTCPKEKTKNFWRESAEDLRVPLVGRAAEIVARRFNDAKLRGGRFLFPAGTHNIGRKEVHMRQKTAAVAVWLRQPYCTEHPEVERIRLPVTHWTPHDLRRTVRTTLASLGCDSALAEIIIGHVKPGIEQVYNLHHYDAERRVWLTKIDQFMKECEALPPLSVQEWEYQRLEV